MIRMMGGIFLGLLLLAAPLSRADAQPFLAGLLARALAENPELKAAEARWHRFAARTGPAAALDDPSLSLVLNNYPVDTWKGNDTAMTGKIVRFSQRIPFPGTLTSRREAAAEQASWYRQVYEDQKLQLAAKVKEAYFSLFFTTQALAVLDTNLSLVKDVIRLTETQYRVGRGLQQDVLKAQVEHSRLADQILKLQQQRQTILATLSRLAAGPVTMPAEPLPPLDLPALAMPVPRLVEQAEEHRPLFRAYQALLKSYQAKRNLARLRFRPSFKVGAAYTFREDNPADDGTDFASLEFGITLPFSRAKRDGWLAEATAALRTVEEQFRSFRLEVRATIADQAARLEKNRDQSLLYQQGLIPQASQSFQASLAAYRVGKATFLTLLDALMTQYRYQIAYYRALSGAHRNLARLEAASGVSLSSPSPSGPSDHKESKRP